MTIRRRALTVLGLTLVSLLGFVYLVLSGIVTSGFSAVERRDAVQNVERVRQAYLGDLDGIRAKTLDWAQWDDTYRFVLDHSDAYREANLDNTAFTGLNLDFLIIADNAGRLVTAIARGDQSGPPQPVPPEFLAAHFQADSPVFRHQSGDPEHRGLLLTRNLPPALFCSLPITRSDGTGDSRGSLVFGRFFDAPRQEAMARLTRLGLRFGAENGPGFDGAMAEALPALTSPDAVEIREGDGDRLLGYLRFPDFYGRQSLVAEVEMPRPIRAQVRASLLALLVSLGVAGLAIALAVACFVERVVLRRLAALGSHIGRIADSGRFAGRVGVQGDDEIALLGCQVDGLLCAVERALRADRRGGAAPDLPPRPSQKDSEPLARDPVRV